MTQKIFRSNFSHRQSNLFAFLGHHHPLTIIFVCQAEIDKTTNAGGNSLAEYMLAAFVASRSEPSYGPSALFLEDSDRGLLVAADDAAA